MRNRFKVALMIVCVLLWVKVIAFAAHLLNQPSDAAFYSGIGLILTTIVVCPAVFVYITRRQ